MIFLAGLNILLKEYIYFWTKVPSIHNLYVASHFQWPWSHSKSDSMPMSRFSKVRMFRLSVQVRVVPSLTCRPYINFWGVCHSVDNKSVRIFSSRTALLGTCKVTAASSSTIKQPSCLHEFGLFLHVIPQINILSVSIQGEVRLVFF